MKQQVFNPIKKRLSILDASIRYTFRIETAHFANNWGSIFSTCFYTISNIIFIDVVYSNVKLVAGYSRDDMLLFMFIGQIGYYLSWLIQENIDWLIEIVNNGQLDLVLSRPVPSLFYITFGRIKLFSVIRDCLPPLLILGFVIHWQNLHITSLSFLIGLLICFMGIICSHIVHFICALPVFWIGQSSNIFDMSVNIEYNIGKIIPYEAYGKKFQMFFTIIVPYLISAGVATSVALGKTPAISALIGVSLVTLAALLARQYAWKLALRAYTSASS